MPKAGSPRLCPLLLRANSIKSKGSCQDAVSPGLAAACLGGKGLWHFRIPEEHREDSTFLLPSPGKEIKAQGGDVTCPRS